MPYDIDMSLRYFVGIDPGKKGALCVVSTEGVFCDVFPCPLIADDFDPVGMASLIRRINPQHVVIEKPGVMPGQGGVSNYSMGRGFGLWEGVLAALQVPFSIVSPQRWRKAMCPDTPKGVGEGKAERKKILKAESLKQALRLAPAHAVAFQGPRGGALDGPAEAFLIARWLVLHSGVLAGRQAAE